MKRTSSILFSVYAGPNELDTFPVGTIFSYLAAKSSNDVALIYLNSGVTSSQYITSESDGTVTVNLSEGMLDATGVGNFYHQLAIKKPTDAIPKVVTVGILQVFGTPLHTDVTVIS